MTAIVVTIASSIIGSSALVSLITFLITRHDNRKGRLDRIDKQLNKLERDSVRTQLLMLMTSYTSDMSEIMKCAEHYFKDIKGDWYMTTLFNHFIEKHGIAKPEWLTVDEEKERG